MTCVRNATAIPGDRLPHLDALRGIAALAVVLHHALLCLPASDPLPAAVHRLAVLRIVELGRPAVILFFVLSGFVLTLCLSQPRDTFVGFALRRAVRLLPPYWAAILASFAAYALLPNHHVSGFSAWFDAQWGSPLSGADLARHLTMLAGPRQFPLDHVAWSLVHELRLSILVPLLVVIAARGGALACLALAALVGLGADVLVAVDPTRFPVGIYGFRFDAEGIVPSLVLGARFVLPFAIGVVLARRRAAISAQLARAGRMGLLGLPIALVLMSASSEAVMTIGAAGLIAIVAGSRPCAEALASRPLVWLGRTSYSLYLVHLPTMVACGCLVGGVLGPRAVLAVAIVLSLGLAEVGFRLVESPSIRWSRAAARAVSRGRRAVPATIEDGSVGFSPLYKPATSAT